MAQRLRRKGKTTGMAQTDEEEDFDEQLELAGYDSKKLQILQAKLAKAKKKRGRMKSDEKAQFAAWEAVIADRLKLLSNPQIIFEQLQENSNKHRDSDSLDETTTESHARLRSKMMKASTDEDQNDQQLMVMTTTSDVGSSGLASMDIDDDKKDYDDEDHDEANCDEKNSDDPLVTQTKRAMEQLAHCQAALHQRLFRAKQLLQDEACWAALNQAAGDKELDLDQILCDLDNAIASTETQYTPGEAYLMMDNKASEGNEFDLLEEIQNTLLECNGLSDILHALNDRLVKPIFHTLFLPDTFLGNRRSFSKVTAGEVNETRTLEFDAFGENLDDAVDDTGKAARSILDDSEILSEWKFNNKLSRFAAQLVNTEATMLGHGVECTELESIPIEISDGGRSTRAILTRPESRGVVIDIFHQFATIDNDKGSAAAITGSPGIGKSWTLFYALQQALLYEGANVLFFYQKDLCAVLFLRRNNCIYAWLATSPGDAMSYLFRRSDVLVLLDPKEAKEGGAKFSRGKRKLMYAASNNELHFKNSAGKDHGPIETFLGPPLDNELGVLLNKIDPSIKPDVIEDRKKNVGNLIRYILNEKYDRRVKDTIKAINTCVGDKKLLEQALSNEGMSDSHQTVAGTLFQVLPKRPERPTFAGYDGQGVQYRQLVLQAANENVRKLFVQANRKAILSYWGKVEDGEYAKMGSMVEKLFIHDLTRSQGMAMKRYPQGKKEDLEDDEGELVVQGGMTVHEEVRFDKVCAEVLLVSNVVAGLARGSELIDAAGPGLKVYQVTVSSSHRMSLKALEHLGRGLGYIGNGGAIASKKLEFHWVVPKSRANEWIKKAPYKCAGQKDKARKLIVNHFLKNHVNFYVLPLTDEDSITFADKESGKMPFL